MSSEGCHWRQRISDILASAARVQEYVRGQSIEHLAADHKTVAAICWEFTVMGEAARHIPEAVEKGHPEVPWREMRGMRNAVVHGYDTVNLEILWDTVHEDLPALVSLLEGVLGTEAESG